MNQKTYLDQWMADHREELISDLALLVSIPSKKSEPMPGAPFGEGPTKAMLEALKVAEKYGFQTKNYDGAVGTADLCDKESAVDILAHMDVVGEGPGWDTDPYVAVMKDDGCMYGRGTNDDKGPALSALFAMRAVRDSGIALKKNARLILGTDEESGSGDLPFYFSKEKSAPYTFSPDCGFPVYNTEKGAYGPVFTKSWEKTTASPRLVSFDGGFRTNVIPSDATAVIAGLTVEEITALLEKRAKELNVQLTVSKEGEYVSVFVKGYGAHASTPEGGNNGNTALLELLCLLPLADCASTTAVKELNAFFPHGDGWGKAVGLAMEDELSGPLTLAFTLLHIDENGLRGQFDSRVPICANEENCKNVFVALASSKGYEVSGTMRKPHHTPADTPFIQTLLRSYECYTGLKGECMSMGGGTYVHDIEGGVAFGPGMPGFDGHAHGANECVNIDHLLIAAKVYAQVLFDMCCEE